MAKKKAGAKKSAKKAVVKKAAKKAPARKAPAKKAAAKKAAARKTARKVSRKAAKKAPRKTLADKMPGGMSAKRGVAKKAPAKQAPAKKAPAKKAPAKKAAKTAPAKMAPAKKAPAAKAPAVTAPARKGPKHAAKPAPIRGAIPSSLGLTGGSSAARSGREEMLQHIKERTETSPAITAGDVDADWQLAYSSGDEAPGGDNPTPDQDVVDEIGEALGVEYETDEELKGAGKIEERDKHRWELDPASKDDFEDE